MKQTAAVLAFAIGTAAWAAQRPAVSREEMTTVEHSVDRTFRSLDVNDPYDLLGFTRGVYLPGFGVVITAEVNLVVTIVTPFSPAPVGARLTKLRMKKIGRLPTVREVMRASMVDAASTLDPVPANERIVFGLTLFYQNFEEREGLPGQIVMQAPKQVLLDYKANRISKEKLDAAIQVQEF